MSEAVRRVAVFTGTTVPIGSVSRPLSVSNVCIPVIDNDEPCGRSHVSMNVENVAHGPSLVASIIPSSGAVSPNEIEKPQPPKPTVASASTHRRITDDSITGRGRACL